MSGLIRIHTDEENQVENGFQARKAKDNNASSQLQNQRIRVPLASISSNTVRIQPSKSGKQVGAFIPVHDVENIGPPRMGFGKSSSFATIGQRFKIHVDEPENVKPVLRPKKPAVFKDADENLTLHAGVTSIAVQRQPLKEIIRNHEEESSLDATFESLDGVESRSTSVDFDRVLLSTDYSEDIYKYLREAEMKHVVKASYMRKQPDITQDMRNILIDWLVEVAEEFELNQETLHLSVAYIDKFLSIMSVLRSKLQLVGTACMFIASKYEEIYPRGVKDFVYVTDDTYSEKQLLRMEQLIYKVFSFSLTVPTMHCFLQYYCSWIKSSKQIEYLASYLCELSMLEPEPYLRFSSSKVALSALILATHSVEEEPIMTAEFEHQIGYSAFELSDCIQALHQTFNLAPSCEQQAIREKYKSSRYHEVSLLLPRDSLPC